MSIVNFTEYLAETDTPQPSEHKNRMAAAGGNLWAYVPDTSPVRLGSSDVTKEEFDALVSRVDAIDPTVNKLKNGGYKRVDPHLNQTSLSSFYNAGYSNPAWISGLWNSTLININQIPNGLTTFDMVITSYALLHFQGDIELNLRARLTGSIVGQPDPSPQVSQKINLYIPRLYHYAQGTFDKFQLRADSYFKDVPGKYSETYNASLSHQFQVINTAVDSRFQSYGTIGGSGNDGNGMTFIWWKENE